MRRGKRLKYVVRRQKCGGEGTREVVRGRKVVGKMY